MFEFNNNKLTDIYNSSNSTIQSPPDFPDMFRIGGLVFDRYNNLWMTNSHAQKAISIKSPDGSWNSLEFPGINSDNIILEDIIITQNNHKWLIVDGEGIFVFDEKNTFTDPNDDEYKKFSIIDENNQTITNEVYSVTEDIRGNIWAGTDKGVVVYYNPENVFSGNNFFAHRPIISKNDDIAYLLEKEKITSIVIDGANRKWIGTENAGVSLISEDGTEEIYNFTSENSPLISNYITSIVIDNKTGEVFLGTDKGIMSYKSNATKADDNFKNVYVYPNPIRNNFEGEITISGLLYETNIKISDIEGNILYETTSNGGQATWNGKNSNGKRVSTGVYLVFCSSKDGKKSHVTKLLFIN